ncbi:NnrS family protein [Bacterioplanoides sp.]|uniref:NnrS family protein n=1 Tax=Bacterioplanoides sp. TaxID=2066072 RepID=UPI003AFF708B
MAFRPFFLGASLYAVIALSLWGLSLIDVSPGFQPQGGWSAWSAHEIVFGMIQGVVIGFLLTTSRNWTKLSDPTLQSVRLIFITWLSARIAWLWADMPHGLLALLDIATPILAAHSLARTLMAGEQASGEDNQGHNWPFVMVLLVFALAQGLYHFLLYQQSAYVDTLQKIAVLLMMAMVLWISNRALPFFTHVRLSVPLPLLPPRLKVLSMSLTWLLVPCYLLHALLKPLSFSQAAEAVAYLTTAVAALAALSQLNLFRLFYRSGVLSEPMLWSIYSAYLWMLAGLLMLSLSFWYSLPWLHTVLVGLFIMVFSMMARVSMGYTGREVTALPGITLSFWLLQLAGLSRVAANWATHPEPLYLLGIVCLLIPMMIFLRHYLPILLNPRVDGKPF